MRTRPGLALVFLLLVSFTARAADPKSTAQALETARSNLTKAVERIKPDPPSNSDLDAALAAVEALKTAIDAGAELEQSDLDYAKAALAARKELRTQRDYVDQRRANVKVHDARRLLDGALKALEAAAAKLQAKEPAAKDFADTRAAADGVKKLADEARPFGKQDAKFATFLAEADATIAKHLKAAEERETVLAVDKQKAQIEEARKALKDAAAAIGKDATDDQFKASDKAATQLVKLLDDGKALEAKSKAYQADAAKVRTELAAAKKKMDEAWTATGAQRLKGEIEPQFKDLQAAAKPLRGKPTPEQLAEARTAAIVVRGLVEKFAPEAARSQVFGQYVAQVRTTLVDVESQIEQRTLGAAQADVVTAQREVEKKSPADDRFQELAAAIGVLEKTLGTVHAKEPLMAKPVADATQTIKDAKAMMAKRRIEVDVERQTAKVEDARKIASDAMQQLQSNTFGKEQVQQAETAVKLIGKVLDEGNPIAAKDRGYGTYDKEVRKRIVEMNDKIAAKKISLAARDATTALNDAVATSKAKIDIAKAPEGKDSDVEAAVQAVAAIEKALAAQAPLEKQDRGYAGQAERVRNNDLFKATDNLEITKLSRELRKKTGEALAQGNAANDQAAGLSDLRGRKGKYDVALSLYRACQSEGSQMTKMLPLLAKVPVLTDGKQLMPREVMELCGQRATETEQLMKDVAPLIKFEDGPKKSFELARAAGKKDEALKQYSECIATGVLLQHDYPDFAERKFEVAGTTLTLGEIIKQCTAQRKSLLGK